MIDTSAILAWLKVVPDRDRIAAALEGHSVRRMSAVSLLEAQIVVRSREHPAMMAALHEILDAIDGIVAPFDKDQAGLAAEAFRRYGKGQGHPAQLNTGDCAVYALAKAANEPLLFVGDDFSRSDLETC